LKLVRATILRWVSDDPQPGIVELAMTDRHGHEWRFIEKSAIPYSEQYGAYLEADSVYPHPGGIAGEIVGHGRDADGKAYVVIDTERPWGVWSNDDVSRFEVFEDQIFEIPDDWPYRHAGEC
jgi:hypothetical protein